MNIVFSHIPPFIHDSDEGDEYFVIPRSERFSLLNRMCEHDVSHWFCGM